jgi:hypothetical protein
MSLNIFHSVFIALIFTVVFSQTPPSIDDPDFNTNIWLALCTNVLPAEPARNNFPLKIKIYPDPLLYPIRPNQDLRVTLRGVNPTFDFGAFLIRAHKPFDSSTFVGQWTGIGLGQAMSCSNPEFQGNDAAAQRNVTVRATQELLWRTPATPGTYVFNLTTSERFRVYWADQLSDPIRVQ